MNVRLICLPIAMAAFFSTHSAAQVAAQESRSVSETINVSLTIQTKPKEITLSGLDDIALGFDGTQVSGDPSDAFCLYASNDVSLTFSSRNGSGDQFYLAGTGRNIVYDVNLVSNDGLQPITDRPTFDHDVAGAIHNTHLSTDRACTEGDNALLQINFPQNGDHALHTVTKAELTDGAPHHYHDILTVTVEPVL